MACSAHGEQTGLGRPGIAQPLKRQPVEGDQVPGGERAPAAGAAVDHHRPSLDEHQAPRPVRGPRWTAVARREDDPEALEGRGQVPKTERLGKAGVERHADHIAGGMLWLRRNTFSGS